MIIDDKQGIDIAEFLIKNLQQNQANLSIEGVLNDSSGYFGHLTDHNLSKRHSYKLDNFSGSRDYLTKMVLD